MALSESLERKSVERNGGESMKPQGRSPKPFTERDLQMIREYLETDKSLKEVAGKYGMSDAGLRYKVKKYQKEQESNGKENCN